MDAVGTAASAAVQAMCDGGFSGTLQLPLCTFIADHLSISNSI